MHFARRAGLSSIAITVLMTGCVAVVPIVVDGGDSEIKGNYSQDIVTQMIDAGPIPTEVHGNASDLDTVVFHDLVVRRLRLPSLWGSHSFAIAPKPAPAHGYRLVLVFNPTLDGANSPALQPNAAADSSDRIEFALCRGDIEVTDDPYPRLPIRQLEDHRSRRLSPVSPRFFEERILIRGALCLGDVPISTSFVERQRFEDHSEPEFTHMLSQLLLRVMPFRESPNS